MKKDGGDQPFGCQTQLEARRFFEPGDRANTDARKAGAAGHGYHYVSGYRAGISIVFTKSDPAAGYCRSGHLSGAGNSLREFHPSTHNSFGFAIRGIGGAPDAFNL